MKKVLFISKSDMFGGLEKALADYVNMLNPEKYELTVMTGAYNRELAELLPKHVRYRILFQRKFKGLDRLLIHLSPALLHRIFVRETFDVEISFQEGYPTKLVSGAGKGTKKICWLHNDPYYFDFNMPYYLEKTKLNKALNEFDEIVTVSRFIADAYRTYMDISEMKIVYNPIDFEKLDQLAKEKKPWQASTEPTFRICYAGRLSEEKQVEMLIESVVELHQLHERLELIIIGDGNQSDKLREMIGQANAEHYIRLLGFQSNPYPYIANASVLVCCSKTESFGIVLAEALALGVPVISTKCGGPEEILNGGEFGLLVDQQTSSLTAALERLIVDRTLYAQLKRVSAKAVERFQRNKITNQIELILDMR